MEKIISYCQAMKLEFYSENIFNDAKVVTIKGTVRNQETIN